MSHTKEIATAIGTLAIAVGIGFVMQSSDAAKERYGRSGGTKDAPQMPADPEETAVLGTSISDDAKLQVQSIQLTAAIGDMTIPIIEEAPTLHLAAAPVSILPDELPSDVQPMIQCDVTATAAARPGAMVAVSMTAPCQPNERLTVHHNGVMFSAATDASGQLDLMVPALAADAVFILAFANGDGAVAQAQVDDIDQYDRTILQWRGPAGFQLHAREFGANYGTPGHVWSGSEQTITGIASGENGYVQRLGHAGGAEPLMAEVYTYPSGQTKRSGSIDLSVEAEVTPDNCGREIEAQTLERDRTGGIKTRDLTLAVPGCGAIGSFLVLNNLIADLKVARN